MGNSLENDIYLFQLNDSHQLYVNRLKDFGNQKEVNKTCFKMQITCQFQGNLQEQTSGNKKVLIFQEGMAKLIKEQLLYTDYQSDTIILAKAAKFRESGFTFKGSFPENCQMDSVPVHLKSLISMLL